MLPFVTRVKGGVEAPIYRTARSKINHWLMFDCYSEDWQAINKASTVRIGLNFNSALEAVSHLFSNRDGLRAADRLAAHRYFAASLEKEKREHSFMQDIIDILMREKGDRAVTLDMIIRRAADARPLMSAKELSDLRGLNLRGVVFTQSGIDLLRAMPSGVPDLHLDLRGADIRGTVFKPASTFDGVLIDQTSIGSQTNMRHVTFDDLTYKANIEITRGDVSYMRVMGTSDADPSRHACIHLREGVQAQGMMLAGSHYTQLSAAEGVNLAGLSARGASVLRTHIVGSEHRMVDVQGADFSAAHFAPESSLRYADLTGANFSYATLGGMDFTGSKLIGVKLQGVDISLNAKGVSPLAGAIVDANSLVGATFNGQVVTRDTAPVVHRELGLRLPGYDVTQDVVRAENRVRDIIKERDAGPVAHRHANTAWRAGGEAGDHQDDTDVHSRDSREIGFGITVPTLDTDNLINALLQVNRLMTHGGVTRKCGYDRGHHVNAKSTQAQINRYRNAHDESWSAGGPSKKS